MKQLSSLSERLVGQKMFQILAEAKRLESIGKKILHFEIGDPYFDTPDNIKNAAIESIKNNETHYVNSFGTEGLIDAACEVTLRSRKFKPEPNQILVTPGANIQIFLALSCIINPGDEVIIPDPGFVSYQSIISLIGGISKFVPLLESNEFRVNPNDLKKLITSKTKAIIINSPNNPTGSVLSKDDIVNIYNLCSKHGIYLISDEIYSRTIYTDESTVFYSPSMIDHCKEFSIIINGFSKSYSMTGWRLGVVTAPSFLISKMNLVQETILSCVPPFIQKAGIEALKGDQESINKMIVNLNTKRKFIYNEINKINKLSCLLPSGAFYIFVNIKNTGLASFEISEILLNKLGVAVCPGSIFGNNGEGYIRLCYAVSDETINEGISRISNYFN